MSNSDLSKREEWLAEKRELSIQIKLGAYMYRTRNRDPGFQDDNESIIIA